VGVTVAAGVGLGVTIGDGVGVTVAAGVGLGVTVGDSVVTAGKLVSPPVIGVCMGNCVAVGVGMGVESVGTGVGVGISVDSGVSVG
jgi:hypothetical protein